MTEENNNAKTTVGSQLSKARENAGISIDTLQKKTKIQKKYLVAIENNDFDALPGKFYVRAFVRQFANTVGLDGEEILKQYLPEEAPSVVKENSQPVEEESSNTSRSVNSVSPKPKVDTRRYAPIAVIVAIIVLVIGVVIFAVVKTQTDSSSKAPENSKVTVSNEDNTKKTEKKTAKKTLKKGETEITAVKDSTSDFTVKTGDETSKLELNASTAANATVKINGNQTWTGTLNVNAGHTVDIPKDTKDVTISLTNAPVSSVKLNDKSVVMQAPAQGQNAQQRDMNLKFEN
ncbi:helix-turn-helix domain-containing protein [Fructilactobacillus vespulae]|uniref:helix-turn-helix domain-containing protein n=1 Tax=Fructilactobacillus vespulae TaxID=1249630 RepID=UPI0039B4D4E5